MGKDIANLDNTNRKNTDEKNFMVYGRVPVLELLKTDKPINKILISKNETKGSILKIIAIAKSRGIPIKEVTAAKLNSISSNLNHQDVIAFIASYKYCELDDIFNSAATKKQNPFIVILDEIEDPHNMGAIIRTAEATGADGIIIPKRRSVGLTPIVMKASAGACAHIPIVRVSNLMQTINILKEKGVWIYALEACGQNFTTLDYKNPLAIVIGSEGKGISRLIKENSDFVVSIPMKGQITSLNASVAAGVFMYQIVSSRC